MVDSFRRSQYKRVPKLPQIIMHDPQNINNLLELSFALTKIKEKFYDRTLIFNSALIAINILPMLYILIQN